MNKYKRVSLVIPVYNEADQIHDCLRAVAAQSVQPFEVIVVDNNSTDGTAALARTFPFVRVLSESRQGVVYARDRGFNAARGDIIARIDADTWIAPDWIQTLQQLFFDATLDIVTGSVQPRGIGAARLAGRIDLACRRYLYRRLGNKVGLQGANMALRRSVWQTIKHDLCHEAGLHEDFDIGVHAQNYNFTARFDERLRVSAWHRQQDTQFSRYSEYALTSPRTYLYHGITREGRIMYQIVALALICYPLVRILSRGYDERLGRFSFTRLFTASLPPRVNPATFIDVG